MDTSAQQTKETRKVSSDPATNYSSKEPGSRSNVSRGNLPPPKVWGWFILTLLTNYLIAMLLFPSPETPVTVPYTVFKKEVGKGTVEAIYGKGETVAGKF